MWLSSGRVKRIIKEVKLSRNSLGVITSYDVSANHKVVSKPFMCEAKKLKIWLAAYQKDNAISLDYEVCQSSFGLFADMIKRKFVSAYNEFNRKYEDIWYEREIDYWVNICIELLGDRPMPNPIIKERMNMFSNVLKKYSAYRDWTTRISELAIDAKRSFYKGEELKFENEAIFFASVIYRMLIDSPSIVGHKLLSRLTQDDMCDTNYYSSITCKEVLENENHAWLAIYNSSGKGFWLRVVNVSDAKPFVKDFINYAIGEISDIE